MTLWTRLAHRDPDGRRFTHTHIFPNLLLLYGDTFSDFAVVEPLGPTRSRHVQYAFVPADLKWPFLTRPLQWLYASLLERMSLKIFHEDEGAWLGAQAGLPNSIGSRALGAREERVWAFQHWVCERTRGERTPGQTG